MTTLKCCTYMTYRIPSPTLKDIQATADTKTSRNATYREVGDLLLLQIAGNNIDAHPLHCCSYMYRLALYPGFLFPSSTHSFAERKAGMISHGRWYYYQIQR